MSEHFFADDLVDKSSAEEAARRARRGGVSDVSETTCIDVADHDLPALTEQAIAALVRANDPPKLFRQSGQVVRVELDEDLRPVAVPVKVDRMRYAMADSILWIRTQKSGVRVSTAPPRDVVENVLATPELPLPGLRGIMAAPFFTSAGDLAIESGYVVGARLYLSLDKRVEIPPVSDNPTQRQIDDAVGVLQDIIVDFPFVEDADRAHAIAMMIVPFAREMVNGPTPIHVLDAPAAGTGKTLLAEVAFVPACGRVGLQKFGRDEEERRKLITSILRKGPAAAIFDNVSGNLDSAALSLLLTATEWEDRVLGASDQLRLANRTVWAATANNVSLSNELARRSVPIRLDARMERPFERSGFRHGNVIAYAELNRGRLIAAALTIIRAWIVAGRPKPARTLGSYESWAHVIGGTLTHAGITGFLENVDRLLQDADAEGAALRAFVDLWADEHADRNVSAATLVPLAEQAEINVGTTSESKRDPRTQRLAKLLSTNRDRVFGSHRVEKRTTIQGTQQWGLCRLGGVGGPGGPVPATPYVKTKSYTQYEESAPPSPPGPPETDQDEKVARGDGAHDNRKNSGAPRTAVPL